MIREKLIPALVGRSVSDIERRILALPVRLGGIGLSNPVLSADVSTLHQPALLEILPTMTEYKLRITSNWSRHKKNGYCRMNTINYLKRLMLELNDRWHLLEKRDLDPG